MTTLDRSPCFLFDNGSLRAASTLSLRCVAAALAARIQAPVRAVSLLHSSAINTAALGGAPAELLEPALDAFFASGGQSAVLLPLFFGPSAALTDYVPARVQAVLRRHPRAQVRLARWLVDPAATSDWRMATILSDAARVVMKEHDLHRPAVVLVDHGSPQPAVAAVRDFLAVQVHALMMPTGEVSAVVPASMERRPEEHYAFNEPLLERALRQPPCNHGDVVVLLQFLSPGRHAGPQGDVARICADAETALPGLRTHLTEPIASDLRLVDILAERYYEAMAFMPGDDATERT